MTTQLQDVQRAADGLAAALREAGKDAPDQCVVIDLAEGMARVADALSNSGETYLALSLRTVRRLLTRDEPPDQRHATLAAAANLAREAAGTLRVDAPEARRALAVASVLHGLAVRGTDPHSPDYAAVLKGLARRLLDLVDAVANPLPGDCAGQSAAHSRALEHLRAAADYINHATQRFADGAFWVGRAADHARRAVGQLRMSRAAPVTALATGLYIAALAALWLEVSQDPPGPERRQNLDVLKRHLTAASLLTNGCTSAAGGLKCVYPDEASARAAARYAARSPDRLSLRPYRCSCGAWHLADARIAGCWPEHSSETRLPSRQGGEPR